MILPALNDHAERKLALRGFDIQEAEDLVQDALLRVLERGRSLRSIAALRRYTKAVISNLVIDRARRRMDPKDPRRESRDLMDLEPLSLDAPWARGER